MNELHAEDVGHYWKTSRSSPDVWLDRARREIEKLDGVILREAFGSENSGRAAYMLEFELCGDVFRVVWPVLPSRTKNIKAAKVQAATLLYRDIKARCMSAKVKGARPAFFSYLLLPDGRTASQASAPELMHDVPEMITAMRERPQLISGEIVEEMDGHQN
jgi:hypothetical protein